MESKRKRATSEAMWRGTKIGLIFAALSEACAKSVKKVRLFERSEFRTFSFSYRRSSGENAAVAFSLCYFLFCAKAKEKVKAPRSLYIAILLAGSITTAVNAQTDLTSRLDTLIKYNLPTGSEVGISIYDLTSKKSLYAYRDTKLSRPASTMKLITAITLLARADSNRPFRTEVWYRGTIARDTLQGDLYVVGGFDPEFGDEGMNALVDSIAAFPFRHVTGRVYGDVSAKDSLYWGSGWAWDDNPASFQPYMSPLMYHKGMVELTVQAGQAKGDSARVECDPLSTYYTLTNQALSRTPAEGKLSITRNWLEDGNNILVKGNAEGRVVRQLNVYSSQDFFLHVFLEKLFARGLSVPEGYAYAELPTDTLANRIGAWECSVQTVLNQMMKESDNLNAEAMFWRIGQLATGKKHVSAGDCIVQILRMIRTVGNDPANFKIADGCGLSNYDYISPALLVDFLKYAYGSTNIFRRLYKSLPVAGIDGTLKNRMKNTKAHRNVQAKTGTFTGISALAGYAQTAGGHQLAFAIMNQNTLSASEARAFQDKVCELLTTLP